jgi:hypothetical protein
VRVLRGFIAVFWKQLMPDPLLPSFVLQSCYTFSPAQST